MLKLNIIYDARRQEKYHPLMDGIEEQGIKDFELWPCIMYNDVPSSINASHKMIVRDAKEKGLDEVCIAEDDLWFPAKDGWEYFLKNKPSHNEYDIYVASTYVLPVESNVICGFHLYVVSSCFYDQFLSVPDHEHIDTAIDALDMRRKICYPFAALQRAGWSSNNRAVANYNWMLKPEDIHQ